jgi:hypothetical protein
MGNQSSVIFGALIIAFFIFITLKGELPVYAGLLLLSPKGSGGTSGSDITSAIIQGAIG